MAESHPHGASPTRLSATEFIATEDDLELTPADPTDDVPFAAHHHQEVPRYRQQQYRTSPCGVLAALWFATSEEFRTLPAVDRAQLVAFYFNETLTPAQQGILRDTTRALRGTGCPDAAVGAVNALALCGRHLPFPSVTNTSRSRHRFLEGAVRRRNDAARLTNEENEERERVYQERERLMRESRTATTAPHQPEALAAAPPRLETEARSAEMRLRAAAEARPHQHASDTAPADASAAAAPAVRSRTTIPPPTAPAAANPAVRSRTPVTPPTAPADTSAAANPAVRSRTTVTPPTAPADASAAANPAVRSRTSLTPQAAPAALPADGPYYKVRLPDGTLRLMRLA